MPAADKDNQSVDEQARLDQQMLEHEMDQRYGAQQAEYDVHRCRCCSYRHLHVNINGGALAFPLPRAPQSVNKA